ncbi:alpha/beta hydrolase [Litchfieldella qijiaojingensis]|uniref:Alpha/beta hydrolase n=1 Tax=Litchfieldella qijiaojingensis TaxID=980347 RepID=A0ABQ2YN36_9GAMM|nr:patatin-like phospholipase family protein [Halomonas qijiaojingensis]GGX89897.1 alpha/beta hydrolase [Halomonas qijiaojingensis]
MPTQRVSKCVDLALQGGGSHGAFTWGVLDRLLEHERLEFGGLSGTSAGAMNAVVLASGWAKGGRQGARDALSAFWHDVGHAGNSSLPGASVAQLLFGHWNSAFMPLYRVFDAISRLISPYQMNPFNVNPLRELLDRHVNFERLHKFDDIRLFVCATNVHTGKSRVFRNAELSREAVLASAALPVLFHAVEIEGESYWDGGYSANPSLLPLVAESRPGDLMLVQINPLERPGVPRLAHDIIDRINEISFNSSLHQDLRTIALIKRLLVEEEKSGHDYQAELFRKIDSLHLHRIEATKEMNAFDAFTRMNAKMAFIERLHDIGYRAAERWLDEHFVDLGKRSTVDLCGEYADSLEVVK